MKHAVANARRALTAAAAAWLTVAGMGFASVADAADAAAYPNRAIRIVVPTAPGTGDVLARVLATRLADVLGQPVTIDNRPGASYNIASDIVAKSPADGYTLLFTGSVITLLPSTLGAAAVDPIASFAPITKLVSTPMVIVAIPALGAGTLDELIALARERPGRIAYATPGIGTVPHLSATIVARRAGVEFLHVPYNSSGQALKDMLQGEVPVSFTFLVTVGSYVKSGQLKALAVASSRRVPAWPEVPTLAELGFKEAAFEPWYGVLAPAGTPPEIVERLHRELAKLLEQPDIRARLSVLGMEPVGLPPDRFAADIAEAVARWPAIVKAAGIRPE